MSGINGLKIIKATAVLILAPILVSIISTMFDVFYNSKQQTVVKNTIILDGKNITEDIQTGNQPINIPIRKTENINKNTSIENRDKCTGSLDDSIDCQL